MTNANSTAGFLSAPKVVAATAALALAATLLGKLIHADPTLFGYSAVVVASLVQAAGSARLSTFRVRLADAAVVGAAVIAISVALLFQHLIPICVGLCELTPGNTSAAEAILLANLVAPIAETIVFQGWVYDAAKWAFGSDQGAVLVSAFCFAFIHLALTPTIIVAAFALAILRQRTNSLGPPTIVHLAINLEVTLLYLRS